MRTDKAAVILGGESFGVVMGAQEIAVSRTPDRFVGTVAETSETAALGGAADMFMRPPNDDFDGPEWVDGDCCRIPKIKSSAPAALAPCHVPMLSWLVSAPVDSWLGASACADCTTSGAFAALVFNISSTLHLVQCSALSADVKMSVVIFLVQASFISSLVAMHSLHPLVQVLVKMM